MNTNKSKSVVTSDSSITDIDAYITEKYKCMLSAFKFLDLQRILLAFDRSIVGDKSELLIRAIDLITYPPNDFDSKDYFSVIGEDYLMKYTLTPDTLPPQTSNILGCVHSRMFEIIDVILAPVFLNGENTGVVFNELKTMQKKIILSGEQCNDIRINMDNDKNEYIYQMHIRVSQSNLQLEKTDSLPHICFIHINDTICPLPPQMSIEDETDNVGRRLLKPIDCTQFLILDPNEENKITVTWKPDGANYIMAMYLVKKRSANNLLMKLLKPRSQQSVAESKSDIIKRISNPKSDLERVSNRFSLMCPSGKAKIKIPVKSLHCDHLQCFDARTYISTNDESPSWKCPVCNKFCFYDDLRIDFYVLEIIIKVNIVSRRTRREILNDSALKVYFANTNEIAIIMDDNLTKNLINFMNSNKCYGSNNGPVNFHRKYEEKKENLKLIVDELLSHNEGNTNKDEVQLVKTAQPESTVNSVSQFEIQSAEGVSYSSNRGVEIKVDSTTRINDRTSDHKNDGQDCGEVRTTEVTQSESPFN